MYSTLADDNYAVRVAYVRATGERPRGVSPVYPAAASSGAGLSAGKDEEAR